MRDATIADENGNQDIPEMTLAEMAGKRGIECPDCGCRMWWVETTRPADGVITRYRVCRHCGRRKTTIES